MRVARAVGCGVAFALLVTAVGCGDRVTMAEVSGTVKVDGTPAADGTINFAPDDGPSAGAKIQDGRYTAQVPVGRSKVIINVPKVIGKRKAYATDPNSSYILITKETLPPKYNEQTELTLDVQRGKNDKDFDLPTK